MFSGYLIGRRSSDYSAPGNYGGNSDHFSSSVRGVYFGKYFSPPRGKNYDWEKNIKEKVKRKLGERDKIGWKGTKKWNLKRS